MDRSKNGINDEPSQVAERPAAPPGCKSIVEKGGLTDRAIAADFKRRLIEAYEPVLRLVDEIRSAGFEPVIGSALGPMGKEVVHRVQISKHY